MSTKTTTLAALEAALNGMVAYVTSHYGALRGGAFNSEDDPEDDFRRIQEANKVKDKPIELNSTTLPFLVMSMTGLSDEPLRNVPRQGKFQYMSEGKKGPFRLMLAKLNTRIYTTTFNRATEIMECLYLFEDTKFSVKYKMPWIHEDQDFLLTIVPGDPRVQKISGIGSDGKGQIFRTVFDADLRFNMYGPSTPIELIEQVNIDLYDWTKGTLLDPAERPGDNKLLDPRIVVIP